MVFTLYKIRRRNFICFHRSVLHDRSLNLPFKMKELDKKDIILSEELDDLSNCERGENCSVETESLTRDLSLVSSLSNDTSEESLTSLPEKIQQLRMRNVGLQHEKTTLNEINVNEEDYLLTSDEEKKKRRIAFGVTFPSRIIWSFLLPMIAFRLIFFSATPNASVHWRILSRRTRTRLKQKIEKRSALLKTVDNRFTIRLSGNRLDLLHRSLEHHAHCDDILQVQIHWTAKDESFPVALLAHSSRKVVAAQYASQTTTDAVLLLEEGITLTCENLNHAFREWKLDPSRIVGFLPDNKGNFSQLSDSAAFVHRHYLSNRPQHTISGNCQHFVLSAFITTVSGKGPILIVSNILGKEQIFDNNSCIAILSLAAGNDLLPAIATRYLGIITHSF